MPVVLSIIFEMSIVLWLLDVKGKTYCGAQNKQGIPPEHGKPKSEPEHGKPHEPSNDHA